MLIALMLAAAALQGCAAYNGPIDGAVHVCNHAYKVTCSRSGAPASCSATGKAPAEVDHFDVRDESGKSVFARSTSGSDLFTNIGISNSGYPKKPQLFIVGVEKQTGGTSGGTSSATLAYSYYFQATPAGLIALPPALSCGEGRQSMLSNPTLWPPSGMAVGCGFDVGYFSFTVELEFDFDHHRWMPIPPDKKFRVATSAGTHVDAAKASKLHGYKDHDSTSATSDMSIAIGDNTQLISAWVPIELHRVNDDVTRIAFDPQKLWLHVKTNDRALWIRGSDSFESIGLHSAQRP